MADWANAVAGGGNQRRRAQVCRHRQESYLHFGVLGFVLTFALDQAERIIEKARPDWGRWAWPAKFNEWVQNGLERVRPWSLAASFWSRATEPHSLWAWSWSAGMLQLVPVFAGVMVGWLIWFAKPLLAGLGDAVKEWSADRFLSEKDQHGTKE